MRQTKWRFVLVGSTLIVLAAAFFFGMGTMASRSNDPAALMQTVGQVSGGGAGLGLVLIVFGLIGRKKVNLRG